MLSDIELAHYLVFGDGPGIILNAGTGSIAFGRNSKGKTARAGGLGPLLGDEGSAFWIGREYLRSIIKTQNDIQKWRPVFTGPDAVTKIAALAKTVLTRAQKKSNSLERKIINESRRFLTSLIQQVKNDLHQNNLPVIRVGGLFKTNLFKEIR